MNLLSFCPASAELHWELDRFVVYRSPLTTTNEIKKSILGLANYIVCFLRLSFYINYDFSSNPNPNLFLILFSLFEIRIDMRYFFTEN